MINHRAILPIIFSVLTTACTFTSSGDFFVEPVAGEPATIVVSTSLDTLESPILADSLELIYKVELWNGELYYVECLLEDLLIYDSITAGGSDTIFDYFYLADTFEVTPALELDSGAYSLYLNFYYSTNTNSLADIYSVEMFIRDTVYTVLYRGIQP